jgi:hypothetical protein
MAAAAAVTARERGGRREFHFSAASRHRHSSSNATMTKEVRFMFHSPQILKFSIILALSSLSFSLKKGAKLSLCHIECV